MMTTIKNVYKKYTEVPMEKIDEILKHDLMWDAETCKTLGLVDEIV
jgi:ATP-dependent protease ClpP protease subunit